ncbi:MAG TPA: DUF4010 domain-containing protein [Bryobacteraceae bacterium]|nr:DUF4010 domain-containing protein [Bryobacteraceae bacterium]
MNPSLLRLPPKEIAVKMAITLGIGLLVGFEREWSHKDLGVRTFAIIALLGTLAALISSTFVIACFAGVLVLVTVVHVGNALHDRPLETTTSGALMVTFALGVLTGNGHVFTPTAFAIVMTLLLSLKPQFSRFAGGLTHEEVRGAVFLGLIGFVVYPLLPDRFIDPWGLVNPREAWLTIILIAAIGFINYVLLRLYSRRGLYYGAIFGGLVNSTATIAELGGAVQSAGEERRTLSVILNLLTIEAMFVRNLVLLAIFSPPAAAIAVWPIASMALCGAAIAHFHQSTSGEGTPVTIGSPVRIGSIARFGLLFIVIQAATSLGQRILGNYGTIGVSVLGGLASSASTTAAAASLARHGSIAPDAAALATVLTSIASAAVNLPILYRATGDSRLLRTLVGVSALIVTFGLIVLGVVEFVVSRR